MREETARPVSHEEFKMVIIHESRFHECKWEVGEGDAEYFFVIW